MSTKTESAEVSVLRSLNEIARYLTENRRQIVDLDPNSTDQHVQAALGAMAGAADSIRDALQTPPNAHAVQKKDAESCFPYLRNAITKLLAGAEQADSADDRELAISMYVPKVVYAANLISTALTFE
ncbi:hypothetical protein GALL_373780 [mine drainage metagenome]|uniref:Uncharacterized protein n=1 Tax=mine drainage metagenome TaxID=410659 RepID=A0A1J5QY84_9ZZZZ